MRQSQLGNLGVAALALLNVVLWIIFPPENGGGAYFAVQVISEILSSTGMVLIACAIILSLRPRFLEPFFGGLDKMYKTHKTAALSGLALVLLHFLTMPGLGEITPGRLLGKIALFGMLTLVALTVAPRLPVLGGYLQLAYHHWRWTHKLIGAFFILGMLHTFNVKNVLQTAEIPALYWKIVAYAGAGAYVYQIVVAPFVRGMQRFTVTDVQRLNNSTIEVTLTPDGKQPIQRAGQFAFVRFPDDRVLREPHPFTVSSSPDEPSLRLSIKAAGDWTKHLYQHITPGVAAQIDGCYGEFDHTRGGPQQIWIAGGIGVTPFLSWVRTMVANPGQRIHFFYTVRAESDALFWDEFAAADQRYTNFSAILNISSRDGSLTIDRIAATVGADLAAMNFYLCGPLTMTQALSAGLLARGVPRHHIHFEEFNFR
ncbi:MAG: ferredoxin reductase family protein [Roseiflexaceae bacterium]|nr:ferredoxin reductase family protein [Roseiflexaceae bacterium]